jgi:hypothetical protein
VDDRGVLCARRVTNDFLVKLMHLRRQADDALFNGVA